MVELYKMPVELLEHIFTFTESSEILALSETCNKFNFVIAGSQKLSGKLTLYINYPENMELFADMISQSRRRYRNIKISKSREQATEKVRDLSPQRYFANICSTIRCLELNWSNSSSRARENSLIEFVMNRRQNRQQRFDEFYDPLNRVQNINNVHNQIRERARNDVAEFTSILKEFKNLTTMKWTNVHLERHHSMHESLSHLVSVKELVMKHCDAYCFEILSSCNQLQKFSFSDPFWGANRNPGIESLETFLVKQNHLKSLSLQNIQYPRLFYVDRSASINFKLNSLTLKNVYFKDSNIAEKFFRTQNELRSIDFQLQNEKVRSLDEVLFYNNILKIVFTNNSSLNTVNIEKNKYKIENCDFLSNIRNRSVQNLTFNVTSEDKDVDLFKNLVRMCPNLKNVSFNSAESEDTDCCKCFDVATILDKTQSLTILNSSVRSLINVYAENLQSFEYAPGKTGEFIDDFIGGFLHRHRTIKKLTIGSRNRSNSYFFVSYNLCQLICDFLQQLEDVSIFNFGEVNKSVKLLCSLRNLRTLTISAAQYQQFTAKTKVECDRNKIKLIPVEVEIPRDVMDTSMDFERI